MPMRMKRLDTTIIRTHPRGRWNSLANQRLFLDDLAKKLNITKQQEWYKITAAVLRQHGGNNLLVNYYNGSLTKLLSTVYPEYPITSSYTFSKPVKYNIFYVTSLSRYTWDIFQLYHNAPRKYWHNLSNQRSFMDNLAKKLNITDHQGWYQVTSTVLQHHGGKGLLAHYDFSPSKLLKSVYPEYPKCISSLQCT